MSSKVLWFGIFKFKTTIPTSSYKFPPFIFLIKGCFILEFLLLQMGAIHRDSAFFAYKTADAVVIRIKGYANYLNVSVLSNFLKRMEASYHKRYCILFEECDGLDSTCLGILAGLLLRLKKGNGICLFCGLKPRPLECIRMVGLDKLACIIDKTPFSVLSGQDIKMDISDKNKTQITPELVLEAHKFLLELNAHNKVRFQDVISLLEKTE